MISRVTSPRRLSPQGQKRSASPPPPTEKPIVILPKVLKIEGNEKVIKTIQTAETSTKSVQVWPEMDIQKTEFQTKDLLLKRM